MVDFKGVQDKGISVTYSDFEHLINKNNVNPDIAESENVSIFSSADAELESNIAALNEKLEAVEDKQGIFSKAWNGIKEFTNIGTSVEKCDAAIEKYKNGEITFEEASAEIDNFDAKQKSSLNLFANIATSIAAIAAVALAVPTGGASLGAAAAAGGAAATATTASAVATTAATIGVGAAAGAATKVAYKCTDRATNNIDGDALDKKEMAKDALSGAVTGAIAGVTAGTGETTFLEAGKGAKLSTHVLNGAKSSAKTGLVTGAVAGGSNYAIDCKFDDDKEFNFGEFAKTTATSSAVGGVVGGIMGSGTGALRHAEILTASNDSVLANSCSTASYKITNDRIRAIAA